MSDPARIESRKRNAELIEPITPLFIVLGEFPALLTEEDIAREVAGDDTPIFAERDAVERGVREMLAAGVLRREGDSIIPTKAALFLDDHLSI